MGNRSLEMFGWVMVATTVFMGCAADNYTVGDSLGWNIPPASNDAYQTWARYKDFDIGDNIIFTWSIGTHDVAQVTEEGYQNCIATNNTSLSPIQTTSPVVFTLNSTTPYYFICTVGDHCRRGQKVIIHTEASAAAPSISLITKAAAILLASSSLLSFM